MTPRKKTKIETSPIDNGKENEPETEEVPRVLYAPDGRKFYPCAYCRCTFSNRRPLVVHMRTCTYKVHEVSDSESEDIIVEDGRKQINIIGNVVVKQKTEVKFENRKVKAEEVKPFAEVCVKEGIEEVNCEEQSQIEGSTNEMTGVDRLSSEISEFKEMMETSPNRRKLGSRRAKRKPEVEAETRDGTTQNVSRKTRRIEKLATKKPKPKQINAKTDQSKPKVISVNQKSKCAHCSAVFNNALDLLRHKRKEHAVEKSIKLSAESLKIYDKVYQNSDKNCCPLCQVPVQKSQWKRHLETHGAVSKVFCKVCKKGFNRIDHKREHEKRHLIIFEDDVDL